MDKLPELEIVDDLATIEAEEEQLNIVVEDLSQPLEPADPTDIFIGKPTNGKAKMPTNKDIRKVKKVSKKEVEIPDEISQDTEVEEDIVKPKKKPLSDKQKAHLERIRVKALEAKKEKARMKKEIKEKVETEVKQKRQRKKKETPKEELSEDFKERLKVPSEEEVIKKKQAEEQMSFINFMNNMEKYQKIRFDYESKKQKEQPKPQPPKPKPQPKPQNRVIPETIKPKEVNPYDAIFQW